MISKDAHNIIRGKIYIVLPFESCRKRGPEKLVVEVNVISVALNQALFFSL